MKVRSLELFRQLRAWWAVAAPEMTDGKRKSIELAGCLIGERTTPPSLKLPKGKTADEIVAALRATFDGTFIATKHRLDKPAIIKAIRPKIGPVGDELTDEQAQALIWHSVLCGELGLDVSQTEEFFIDRPRKEAEPETVAVDEEAVS